MQKTFLDEISALERSMDGIIIVNTEGRIIYHKFLHFDLTLKESDLVGKRLEEVFRDYDMDTSPLCRALRYGEYCIHKLMKLQFYNGEELWAASDVYPVKENGQIVGAVSALQAVSETPVNAAHNIPRGISPQYPIQSALFTVDDIIGESPSIKRLKSSILKLSNASNVMVVGDTGTGKELVAQVIHSHSRRNHRPFIVQNCAAVPATLLERLFFGVAKGSFKGAEDSPGIFEQANGGTVFLDEVNSMDITLQAKLLRVLEDHTVVRLGGQAPVPIDVRIVSAASQPPKVCLAKGHLRRDLFYKLATLQVRLPALAERMDDLKPLIDYFIGLCNKKTDRKIQGVSPEVFQLLCGYDWPGNVRELKNVIETAYHFAKGELIAVQDIPDYIWEEKQMGDGSSPHRYGEEGGRLLQAALPLREAMDQFEKDYILSHSQNCHSLVQLADSLSISKQLLNYKLKKYGLKISF